MGVRRTLFRKKCDVCKIIGSDKDVPKDTPGVWQISQHIVKHELFAISMVVALVVLLSIFVLLLPSFTLSNLPVLGLSSVLIVLLGILFEKHYGAMYDMSNDPKLTKDKIKEFKRNYVSNSIRIMAIAFLMCILILAGLLSLCQAGWPIRVAIALLLFSSISIAVLLASLAISSAQNVQNKIKKYYEKGSKNT